MVIWGKYCDTGIGSSEDLTEPIIVAQLLPITTLQWENSCFADLQQKLKVNTRHLHDRACDKELSRQMVGS